MAVKWTNKSAGIAPFSDGSLMLMAEENSGVFSSVKITLTQAKVLFGADIAKLLDNGAEMDAGQTITYNSSGGTKAVIADKNGTQKLLFDETDKAIYLSADGTTSGTQGFIYVDFSEAVLAFNQGSGGEFSADAVNALMCFAGTACVEVNATGMAFFSGTPVAQPTGVAVTAGAIHAALVSLNLITA